MLHVRKAAGRISLEYDHKSAAPEMEPEGSLEGQPSFSEVCSCVGSPAFTAWWVSAGKALGLATGGSQDHMLRVCLIF